jgi:hypothetical protein
VTAARRHHFLPQAYLAGFTDTGNKDGRLYVLNVQTGKGFSTAPANVAVKRDFNIIDDDDKPIDALEKAMSQFEGPLSNVLRRIRESSTYPSAEDLNWVLNLVSLVATRNPRRRAMRESFMLQRAKISADLIVSDRGFFKATMRRARDQGHVTGRVIGFEEMRAHVLSADYTMSVPIASNHVPEFRAQGKALEQLGRRSWSLLLAEPGANFICCDHPVSIIPNKDKTLANLSIDTEDTALLFPLSSRMALHGSLGSDHLPQIVKLSHNNVARANTRIWEGAMRQVYSAAATFQIVRRGVEYRIDLGSATVQTEVSP